MFIFNQIERRSNDFVSGFVSSSISLGMDLLFPRSIPLTKFPKFDGMSESDKGFQCGRVSS